MITRIGAFRPLAAAVIAVSILVGPEALAQGEEGELDLLLQGQGPQGEPPPQKERQAPNEQPPSESDEPPPPAGSSIPATEAPTTETSESTIPTPRRAQGIEEIVVTARKREESLQDTPVAVTAISGEQMQRYNVSDLKKIAQMTPQLFVSDSASGNGGTLRVRGIGSSSTSAGFDQAVSIYIDGLQYDRGNILNQGYFDLAHVEVLKGPQALFFGKNNTAGVISLTSADPGPDYDWVGRYGHEFNANENWFEAIGSGPVTDTFSARLGVRYSLIEGYIENLAPATTDLGSGSPVPPPRDKLGPKKNEFLGRLTLKYQPLPDLNLKLKVGGVNLDGSSTTANVEMISCRALGQAQLDPGENCRRDRKVRQNDVASAIAATEPEFNEEKGALYGKYHAYNLVLTADYNLGIIPATLTSVSGYTYFANQYLGDFDFTGSPIIFAVEQVNHRSYSEELRLLTSYDFPANLMLGGYFQNTALRFRNLARVFPVPQDPTTGRYVSWDRHSPTDGQTESVFGQLIWNVTKTVELSPGARYSHVTKDSFAVLDYVHPALVGLFRPTGEQLVGNFKDDDVSPEITGTWRPELRSDAGLTLYAAYKKGFKSGGFSNSVLLRSSTTLADALFASEKVSGFEGGIKSTWFDRMLLFNIVGYRYKFENLQVNFFDSANINYIVENAAAATTTGTEVELEWLPPIDGLNLHGSLSYNLARYDDFLSFCYAGQTSAQGCNLDANGQPATGQGTRQDLSGTQTPISPPWAAGMGLRYEHRLFDLFKRPISFGFGADSSYADNYLLSEVGRFDIRQTRYFRTDASLNLFQEDGSWDLVFIGRNLSDEYFLVSSTVDSPLSGAATGAPAAVIADEAGVAQRGREIALQITVRF